jgi:hypothetical protein
MATRLIYPDNNPLCVLGAPRFSGELGEAGLPFSASVPLSKAPAIRAMKGATLQMVHDGQVYNCSLTSILTIRAIGDSFGTATIWGTVSPLAEQS